MAASEWRAVELGQVVEPFNRREIPSPTTSLPYIGLEHVASGSGAIAAHGVASSIKSSSPLVDRGDVLYGRLRPYLNKVTIAPFDAYASGEFIVFKPNEHVEASYLRWLLASHEFVSFATSLNAGDRPRVKWNQIRPFRFGLPSLSAQRRIVDILEAHLSRLDAGESWLADAEARMRRLSIAANRAVIGKLEHVYGVGPALEAIEIENGATVAGLADALSADGSGRVPYYKVGDMNLAPDRQMSMARSYISERDAQSLKLHVRDPGSVLIPKRGGAIATNKKRIVSTRASWDMNTMGLRPRDGYSVEFIWHWLDGIDLGAIADGSNVPQINARQIRSLSVPTAPSEAQEEVVQRLDKLRSVVRMGQISVNDGRARSKQLRRALLAAAFSGQLTGHASDTDRIEEMTDASAHAS
ncbi:restriction endonuclease subunit S [Agrococcus sp. ARC_14]|uniref:restriction endonuclease subunit S n=1 Tax=Agrococcus sp. ARC_14 TaxID=2919927 RepID=UPI001F053B57|nr:restriction endonuclease subunit S [Agrococcus sp. ARC_14]MCH1883041.1 restriction endonuclease subunit S [Agrococcus sp. ARC_14]